MFRKSLLSSILVVTAGLTLSACNNATTDTEAEVAKEVKAASTDMAALQQAVSQRTDDEKARDGSRNPVET